jgi:hypothetical protein
MGHPAFVEVSAKCRDPFRWESLALPRTPLPQDDGWWRGSAIKPRRRCFPLFNIVILIGVNGLACSFHFLTLSS